jgi:Flp pilus assembly pilin Flp
MQRPADRHRRARRRPHERGASLVEYALIVALIAIVCVAGLSMVGGSASGKLGTAGDALASDRSGSWTTFTSFSRPPSGWGDYSFRMSYDGGSSWVVYDPGSFPVVSCDGATDCQYQVGKAS